MCLGLREREDPRENVTFKKKPGKNNEEEDRITCADEEGMDTLDRVHHLPKGTVAPQSMAKI